MISAVIEYKNNKIVINDNPVKIVGTKFTKGFYEATIERDVLNIERKFLPELHEPFESEENKSILRTVTNFFKKDIRSKINKMGFTHKLGVLAYGEPGCGKTSLFNFVANSLIEEHDAIVFFCDNANSLGSAISLAGRIREIQDEPIVFIADEFDRFATQNESEMKNLLDGKDSVENSLFLATTNYIDRIPATLKSRESRFGVVREIKGITNKDTMYNIAKAISTKITPPLYSDEELLDLFKDKDSITLDGIKNICLRKVTDTYIIDDSKTTSIGFKLPTKLSEDEKLREEIEGRWITGSSESISSFKDKADKS